jgi:hypothetical protein
MQLGRGLAPAQGNDLSDDYEPELVPEVLDAAAATATSNKSGSRKPERYSFSATSSMPSFIPTANATVVEIASAVTHEKLFRNDCGTIGEAWFPFNISRLGLFHSEIIGITPGFVKPLILLIRGVIEEAIGEVYFFAKTSLYAKICATV